ncbi:MAG: ADP-ribosylglycohydrolase family protein [Bacilli bacterium]|nr:ADP-ribosylglycohydrolase family protein [Bacilli bacterium]
MSIIKESVLGFAVGDAMGLPLVNIERETLLSNPVTSMNGGGMYNMPKGTWSDETSLTLATMDSIIRCKKIDYFDLANRFCLFLKGEYTSVGSAFDVEETTKRALTEYLSSGGDPLLCGGKDILDDDNGSLMRMLPIALYCHINKLKDKEVYEIIKSSSSITHADSVSVMGCFIYVYYLLFILNGKDKYASYNMIKFFDYSMFFDEDTISFYNRLLKTNIFKIRVTDLKSESYIVYTLESVFWIILNCNSFPESIVGAINLGGDTDTIGAIVGSIAGILYGYDSIPENWIGNLKRLSYIEEIISLFEKEMGVYE